MKKTICIIAILLAACLFFAGCEDIAAEGYGTEADVSNTLNVGSKLAQSQPTPSDIEYSLERYNLIRRAYWVNGMRERARTYPCPIADIPMGYVVLFTESGGVIGRFEVDGKVSSLNSYLTPDSEWYEQEYWGDGDSRDGANDWIADVDGSYGENDTGIFFFTPDGKYIEWNGGYLYSDIPFVIENPVVTYEEAESIG